MTDQRGSTNTSTQNIVAAIEEVSERGQLLIREEIELAKAEVTLKLTKLARGAAIGAAAGIFVIFGVFLLFDGLAWLAYWLAPVPDGTFFWGFFIVAAILFLLGALAGYIASRLFKGASPPTPDMAIDQAKRIRETVTSEHPETTI
jgi:Putative Actinobacterial Holin-X, holin superfamily III